MVSALDSRSRGTLWALLRVEFLVRQCLSLPRSINGYHARLCSRGTLVPVLANVRWSNRRVSESLSNQKLTRALTSTPKAIMPANASCCIATLGMKTADSVPSQRQDFNINWCLFPLAVWSAKVTDLLKAVNVLDTLTDALSGMFIKYRNDSI